MQRIRSRFLFCLLILGCAAANAKTIVVNTEDNSSTVSGRTNLLQAIRLLKDGDTIAFNIAGPGVHYVNTPVDGYPLITANRITIDGYTQPGASPNSNPLHSTNNAQLMIVLSSTNGNGLSMQTAITNFTGIANNNLGFGPDELAILGFFRGSNTTVRGLAFLSSQNVSGSGYTGPMKTISFCPDSAAQCPNWHVSGCWFGLDPATRKVAYLSDGTNVAMPDICIASYRSRNPDGSNPTYAQPGTIGVSAGSTNAPAEFNIFITGYGFDSEGLNYRISGNWWNVLPDGMHNFDPSMANSGNQQGDGYIEVGRVDDNLLIGTDGDGVNDENEGNVFGGVASTSWSNLYLWSPHATNVVIAGNWYGVAIDGVTPFTNSSVVVNSFPATAQVRFGSDFDGVSDALEANKLYNNHPFNLIYFIASTNGSFGPEMVFKPNAGARLSVRGNSTVNNSLFPFAYADGSSSQLTPFLNYETPYMDTSTAVVPNGLIPALETNSVVAHLKGVFLTGVAPYTNISIDVYQADREGWTNGKVWALTELTDGSTYTNGFPQGSLFLKSFPVSNSGSFDIDLTGLDLGSGFVTVTANYSADKAGTHNGRTHTSNFADPIALTVPVTQRVSVSISKSGTSSVVLSWPVSGGALKVQSAASANGQFVTMASQPQLVQVGTVYQAFLSITNGTTAFYRLAP